ncbi:TPA: toprim domain-containing protein [Streptococcus suis]|nr:toprim domain-containing protein [Streptococcus suis]
MASVKELRQVNIVGVAESLGMELKADSSNYYRWKEHNSLVINVRKNSFNWYSREKSGDPIALVQVVREDQTGQPVSFKEAKHYVETGSFPIVDTIDYTRKEFSNYLSRYESKDKTLMVDYLKNERGLSEETIRFFDEKGVLGQANYKNAQGIEPVILFRTLDATGKMIGGSLQGIVENRDLYDRGRLKQTMKHSDGLSGFNVDIGSPKRLIVAEAPIDLMSYYELHKGELNDVRLIAMDGLKEGVISRHYMEVLHLKRGEVYEVDRKKTPQALSNIAKTSTHFKQEENQSVITLAVDNDSAGRKFLSRLEDKGIRYVSDLPPLPAGKDKSDWNDYLKQKKKENNMEIVKETSTIDQSQEKEIASYIESINAEDHGFYLWYDEELTNLGASDEVIEAFHEALPEKTYTINGIQLFVEESVNDGATGYLSLDGNVLDRDGIEDYLVNSELTYDQKISLLQSLEDRLPDIWDEVVQSYEKVYKEIVSRFQLDKKAEADYYVRLHHSMHPSLSQLGDGAVIPYKQLVETLYPENKRLLEERASQIAEALASAGSDLQQITTFDLIDPDGAIVEANLTYDAGDELETIAEKNKTAPYGADLLVIDREVSERLGISHDFKQQKKDETKLGDFPVKQEAAPLPEATNSQPLNDLSPNQTRSQPLLHFTIRDDAKSIHKDYYHPATQKEIAKLNRYALTIQQTAQWYLDKVADSRIIYLYQDGDSISSLAVQFDRDKFMHLTGIYPYQEGQTAEQTLLDFANGKGDFDTILLANKGATFDKVKVLPELEAIVESDSFYFGDLSEVPKLKRLDLDKAIRSGDEDVLLAMRTVDGTTFPASLMKLRQSLKLQLDSTNQERSILGVYRYRDNQLDQLSINEELIKDGGESFKFILDQVVESLNQTDQTDKTVDEDMVYQDQPLVQHKLEEESETEVGFQPSTYRLERAIAKLHRLESEFNQSVQNVFDHQKRTNGQPMNDKRGSGSWFRREGQLDGKASKLRKEIEDQIEYIERLESQIDRMSKGFNRNGQGLRLTIDNIPNIERIIELAKSGQARIFSTQTIRKYEKELERLKTEKARADKTPLSPEAKELIEEGILKQWNKHPNIYFIQGLRKVALELTEEGVFQVSQKYQPKTEKEQKEVDFWLNQLTPKEQVEVTSSPVQVEEVQDQLEPDKQEEAKAEPVDSTSYIQTSNQNKLSELLASKDRAGLTQHLKDGVHQYLNSEQYKDFLNTMSRFPNYSYRNIQLLKAQMPTVQAVASFKSWKEDFGRTVIKGSKSLRIFAPQITKVRDPQTGEVLKDEQGNDKTRVTFKLVPVFDISQTEGKELPKPIYQLEGNHENYSKLYRSAKAYAQSKGLTMEFNSNIGEANGYYSRKENKIVIKAGMSEQQTLKTIYHELAHADLHSSQTVTKDLQYSDAELQAESVAYVVANHYGLDTSEYSFGYLATWVRDKEALSDLEAQLEIVQKEAQHLINSLDKELEKQLEQAQVQTVEKVEPVEKLSFEERLARAEQESKLLAEEQGKEEEQAKKQEAKQSIQER